MDELNGKRIEVQSYKHNGLMHRIWDAVFVVDVQPTYIVVATSKVKVIEHDCKIWYTREPAISIYFKDKWRNMVAMFKKTGLTYYVNLASPAIIENKVIKYIDYDLDIKMFPEKTIKLIDVKEYTFNRRRFSYSEDIDNILKFNVNEIKELMKKGQFPFNDKQIKGYYDKFLKETKENGSTNKNKI